MSPSQKRRARQRADDMRNNARRKREMTERIRKKNPHSTVARSLSQDADELERQAKLAEVTR